MKVTVRGLEGFRAELEVTETKLVDGMRDLMSSLADDIASKTRTKALASRKSGNLIGSIRSQGPVVTAGLGAVYYGFIDFGGSVGKGRTIKRKYTKTGRYLFPSVQEIGIRKQVESTIDNATKGLQ